MATKKHPLEQPQAPCACRLFPPVPDDEIDLTALGKRLWRRRWLPMAAAGLGLLAAALAAFLTPPVYRVEAVLAPVERDAPGALGQLAARMGGVAELVGIDHAMLGGDTTEALALLKSRAFTTAFIKEYELMPILFADRWDAASKTWDVEAEDEKPTFWDAYRKFDQDVRFIHQDTKTGLVTLTVEWQDPVAAAQWAQALVERINAEMRRRAVEEARRRLDYLNRQLQTTGSVEVRQAMYRLIEEATKAMMLADIREEYAFRLIDPPVAPEEDDFVKPKRGLLLVLGLILGGLSGALAALLLPDRGRSHKQ